jgi:chromosome segregation ATPase
MIEPIMYAGLGFLAATLLALVILPMVHARAVRLTMRRLEAATPLSMAEIQADKDQLRAEFAMSMRRLEISVDQLKTKTTAQLAELGKKTDMINRLKAELEEKTATIEMLEARDKELSDELRRTESEMSTTNDALPDLRRRLADKQAKLARITADLNERSLLVDSQRVEIVALRTQLEALQAQAAGFRQSGSEAALDQLAEERGQAEKMRERVAQLEHDLAGQAAESEILTRRLADLEMRSAEQVRLGAEREQLRQELAVARNIEAELRRELASGDRRHSEAQEAFNAEKALIETELRRARDDRMKLQREIATKRETEAAWAAERVENATLRERINDVAAEVARLTSALEGPGSPIHEILGEEAIRSQGNGGTAEEGERGSLADRIRALQARAARLSARS